MILFAYAGNMDVASFSQMAPSAKKIGVGRLPGYEFVFNLQADDDSAKAGIIPSTEPNAAVWGVLIEVNDNERGNFFNPDPETNPLTLEPVECLDESGNIYQAEAFMAKPHAITTFMLPYDWYQERIIKTAQNAGLPREYIDRIAAMTSKPDPDEKRAERRRKKTG